MSAKELIVVLVLLTAIALVWGIVSIRGGCVEGLPCAQPTRVCTCEEAQR